MNTNSLTNIVEAILLAAGRPVTVPQILELFDGFERPAPEDVRTALLELTGRYAGHGIDVSLIKRDAAGGPLATAVACHTVGAAGCRAAENHPATRRISRRRANIRNLTRNVIRAKFLVEERTS